MRTSREFAEFLGKHKESSAVWVSKASDLRGGSRVAVALLEKAETTKVVCNSAELKESKHYKQTLFVRHLSQIEYVYEIRGKSDHDCVRFRGLGGEVLEEDFSCEGCTSDVVTDPLDHSRCFSIDNDAVVKGDCTDNNVSINGEIGVHCVRDNGPPSSVFEFGIELMPTKTDA